MGTKDLLRGGGLYRGNKFLGRNPMFNQDNTQRLNPDGFPTAPIYRITLTIFHTQIKTVFHRSPWKRFSAQRVRSRKLLL